MNESDLRRLTLRGPRRLNPESLLHGVRPASRRKGAFWAGILLTLLVGSMFWKRSAFPSLRELLAARGRGAGPALVERTRMIHSHFVR